MQNGGYFFTRCSGEHEAGRGGRETREWGRHGKNRAFPRLGCLALRVCFVLA